MVQKVCFTISQKNKKCCFGRKKNLLILRLQLLKVLDGTMIQSHYVCCSLLINVPKALERINKHENAVILYLCHRVSELTLQISVDHVKACPCKTVCGSDLRGQTLLIALVFVVYSEHVDTLLQRLHVCGITYP